MEARNRIADCVDSHVPHVEKARWVGKHREHVELVVEIGSIEGFVAELVAPVNLNLFLLWCFDDTVLEKICKLELNFDEN